MHDTLIIGGGQAGLAAGYYAAKRGLDYLIVEAGNQPTGSWARYYDSLKLFSPAGYSSLPGLRFPGDPKRYPVRDEVVDYLAGYARHFDLQVRTGMPIASVRQLGEGFEATTANGQRFTAKTVIAATGSFSKAYRPVLPGQLTFLGEQLHSSQYRHPVGFEGKRVIVIGAGNSAVQIAVELAHIAEVTITSRRPVNFYPQRRLGLDVHFWTKFTGRELPYSWGLHSPDGSRRVLDHGAYRTAITAGKPEYRPLFSRFTDRGVIWQDGQEEKVDAVIFATGFRPNLDFLGGIGATSESGTPYQHEGVSLAIPGLYFVGLSNQRTMASATLRGVGADAQHVMTRLVHHLQAPQTAPQTCCQWA